ncbi:hypothetical protein [Corynebacterium provencense]|uniref:hypothetical protein n=1 Tax=Corynebacterium provencense TaxID=1737425 RepID=UPI0011CB4378|nr:hypothetical protein [Corynebacterium provencense]
MFDKLRVAAVVAIAIVPTSTPQMPIAKACGELLIEGIPMISDIKPTPMKDSSSMGDRFLIFIISSITM